ncbi:hypothetical protein Ahy_A07g031466 [Arachis hypogaea]|uniref:Aminotransferase-like plant mobile domain-containing protein n=1 Tax=Arachis hypogaea TaxID=3818 RepID=A0A445C420_ARAHY|nr:hypothetical protein Ahy_A07g031466 [Arachis hypogaea]
MGDERSLYHLNGVAHIAGSINKESANRVHIRWLPFVARLDGMGSYSWASTALAWLYRCMCRVANRNVTNLAGPLQLLQLWIFWRFPSLRPCRFDYFSFPLASRYRHSTKIRIEFSIFMLNLFNNIFVQVGHVFIDIRPEGGESHPVSTYVGPVVWEPYAGLDVLAVVHPEILAEEHSRLWRTCASLIYFAVIEWHQVDRVLSQFGGIQHVPDDASNIDWLHAKDGRGGVGDPGPSADFLRWWYRVAHKFLSSDLAFADPRVEEITQEAI